MKLAYVTYIANGYTLMATSDTLLPPPVWVFAASIAEVIYYLDQYMNSVPADSPPASTFVPAPIDRVAKAADPLQNQEAQVWPAEPSGFMVRQMQNAAVSSRAMPLDTYCLNVDAVSDALTSIFTPPP